MELSTTPRKICRNLEAFKKLLIVGMVFLADCFVFFDYQLELDILM